MGKVRRDSREAHDHGGAAAGLRYVSYRVSDRIAEPPHDEDEEVHVRGEPEPVSLSVRRAVFF